MISKCMLMYPTEVLGCLDVMLVAGQGEQKHRLSIPQAKFCPPYTVQSANASFNISFFHLRGDVKGVYASWQLSAHE